MKKNLIRILMCILCWPYLLHLPKNGFHYTYRKKDQGNHDKQNHTRKQRIIAHVQRKRFKFGRKSKEWKYEWKLSNQTQSFKVLQIGSLIRSQKIFFNHICLIRSTGGYSLIKNIWVSRTALWVFGENVLNW